MPTSIPYDPSLALGNIVDPDKIKILEQIAAKQAAIEAAEEKLNAHIQLKRNFQATQQQLVNLNISTETLGTKIRELDTEITQAAKALIDLRLKTEPEVMDLKSQIAQISKSIESPLDYNKMATKTLPLAADSLKMDAQYFTFTDKKQSADTLAKIKNFVASSVSTEMGSKRSEAMAAEAQKQVSHQTENHDVAGTLIITATCTHKDAVIIEPCVLDPDKAINVWNTLFEQKININDPHSIQQIAAQEGNPAAKEMYLLSGATYGSSFVGMAHFLKKATNKADQAFAQVEELKEQMEMGAFLTNLQGKIGIDPEFVNNAKRMLSNQDFISHINVITMGAIPTIASSTMQTSVKEFTNFDSRAMMDQLTTLDNMTAADQETLQTARESATTGERMTQIRNSEMKNVMLSLQEIDQEKNQPLDLHSLMTAFTNYITRINTKETIGVPLTYFLKPITRAQLAKMWMRQYRDERAKAKATSGGDESRGESSGSDE